MAPENKAGSLNKTGPEDQIGPGNKVGRHIEIYIYTEREPEREREQYVYVYIYSIYILPITYPAPFVISHPRHFSCVCVDEMSRAGWRSVDETASCC